MRVVRFITAILVVATALPAFAESDRDMLLEIKFGPYHPNIDSEFANATPYADMMGGGSVLMSQLEYEYEVFNGLGVLSIGASIGYSQDSGHQKLKSTMQDSKDSTTFHIVPLKFDLVYRFDYLAYRYNVPLVPFVKTGFDYYIWWITNGVGDVPKSADGSTGRGGTFGGHLSLGLAFLMDFFSPSTAQNFDVDVGVNNTYLFAEYVMSWVNDFGSSNSFDLSSKTFMAGIAFEF
ncbi:MAG: hypothetical protein GXP54_04490 [Deltaproteobacteria bacterium]|nr:hypothetical protein [Deltaproteobacteria bacterium]